MHQHLYLCCANVNASMIPCFPDSMIPLFNKCNTSKMCSRLNLVLLVLIFLVRKLRSMKETHSACHFYTGSAVQQPNKRNPQCLSLLHRRCSGTACQDEKDGSAIILLGISPSIMRPSAFPMLWVPAFPPSPTFLSSADNALE
jgi:hypothetical protein